MTVRKYAQGTIHKQEPERIGSDDPMKNQDSVRKNNQEGCRSNTAGPAAAAKAHEIRHPCSRTCPKATTQQTPKRDPRSRMTLEKKGKRKDTFAI